MTATFPPYHPVIDLWPPLQDGETENVRDLMRKGVMQDLRTWTDINGKEWLVSGREWHVAASELATTNLLRTVDIGKMTEVEMIDYIIFGPNGCTKSGIGDGQKAVVALLAHNLIASCAGKQV
jgi:hypothetical protein